MRYALAGAVIVVTATRARLDGLPAILGGALACFVIRLLGIMYHLNAPVRREVKREE